MWKLEPKGPRTPDQLPPSFQGCHTPALGHCTSAPTDVGHHSVMRSPEPAAGAASIPGITTSSCDGHCDSAVIVLWALASSLPFQPQTRSLLQLAALGSLFPLSICAVRQLPCCQLTRFHFPSHLLHPPR